MSLRIGNFLLFIAVLLALSIPFHASDASGAAIRTCEGCHGFESLHNIQADSDADDEIKVGEELVGYGHIGHQDDCWGCHGFLQSMATGSGPVVPTIISSDVAVITSGYDTSVTLIGSAFTNSYEPFPGYELTYSSTVVLTAADGSTTELTPDSISQNSLTVTIPGTTTTGNYDLRAVKNGTEESNPIVISVIPDVIITDVKCRKKRGRLTIRGSGFSKKVDGTDAYINVEVNGLPVNIISWKDNMIKASVSGCSTDAHIKVNTLFGSAAIGSDKPPKP
jgi:hypothetical protein